PCLLQRPAPPGPAGPRNGDPGCALRRAGRTRPAGRGRPVGLPAVGRAIRSARHAGRPGRRGRANRQAAGCWRDARLRRAVLHGSPAAVPPPRGGPPIPRTPLTIAAAVARLQEMRDQFGFTYFTIFENQLENFAPVVARLTGT